MTLSFRTIAATSAFLLFAMEGVSLAASMSGAMRMYNPSAGTVRHKLIVDQTAATTGTGTGRGIDLASDLFTFDQVAQRVFPAFPGVAQNTEVAVTSNATAMFRVGGGALGFSSGSGGVTSFTTPTTGGGTTTLKQIDWCPAIVGCGSFMNATVPGGQGLINIQPGPNVFGGTFRLLRHIGNGSGAWFVFNPGATVVNLGFNENLRGVTRTTTTGGATSTMFTNSSFWSAGISNLENVTDVNPENQLYSAVLGPSGSIQTLLNFNGTSTIDPPDGNATGFKMTTGTIFVSDATPATPGGGAFTATTAGFDNRDASGNGYIQLVGGAVAYGGLSGNVFFRVTRLTMAVPEPASTAALAFGLVGIAGLAHMRRKRSQR